MSIESYGSVLLTAARQHKYWSEDKDRKPASTFHIIGDTAFISPNNFKCTQVTEDRGTLVFKDVGNFWAGTTKDFFDTFRLQNPQVPVRLE